MQPASLHTPRLKPLTLAVHSALSLMLFATYAQAEEAQIESDTLVISATALKVETPLLETPRSVSSVGRTELEKRNVQQLDETFRYRAGVLAGLYGSDNNTDWFKVRGFDQSTYQDGLRIYRTGFYQWLPEPYGLERVEVFKGPASILYGEAPPGGVINAVSKRPASLPQNEIEIQTGNRHHRQVGFDSSGPANETGSLRYRMVGLYKERDGDLDHTYNDRYYIAPSLEWDVSDATQLTFLASFQKDDGVPTNAFKLPYGTLDTSNGKVDPQTNYSEPGYDKDEHSQSSIGYELRHAFNSTWAFEQDFRYNRLDLDLRSTYIFYALDEQQGMRGHLQRDGKVESYALDNRLVGNWRSGRTEHTLLIGLDYQDQQVDGREADPFPFGEAMDLFNPEYGHYTPVSADQFIQRDIEKQQLGLYLQDQVRIDDRWVLLGSVRYDDAQTDNIDQTNGIKQVSDDTALTWSAGAMYLSDSGLNPYLSYTESFEPQLQTDSEGSLYEPLEGQQWEAGIKYAPAGWDGYVSAAYFDIEENNSIIPGPVARQDGKRTSKGLELEASGYLSNALQVRAAYTYTDARDKDDNRAALIPRHMASLWLDYDFQGTHLAGLKLGAGLRHVGESIDGDLRVPDYTLADLMASYDFGSQWTAQLNVSNLTDEEYVASCDYWCYYGESRSVTASLKYRF